MRLELLTDTPHLQTQHLTEWNIMEYILFNTNAVQIHYSLPFKGSCHEARGDTALIIRHSRSSSFKKTSLGQPTRMSGACDDLV